MVKLSFFQLRVMNVNLKNIKLHLELLTGKLKKKILYILYVILYKLYYTLYKYKQKGA